MVKSRRGDYIQTFTGKKFWPLDPRVEDIDILDIAHALSNQCRYTGHSSEFYSIAEHSIWVASFCPDEYVLSGLLHDASEAYICDIARPLKYLPEFDEYRSIEKNIMRVISEKFNLTFPEPAVVKDIDTRVLSTEAPQLMLNTEEWTGLTEPLPLILQKWQPKIVEQIFLTLCKSYHI